MSVKLINATGFWYGEPDGDSQPKLPEGFTLRPDPGYFLTCVGPDGKEWFVNRDKLIRMKRADEADVERTKTFKLGDIYVDDRESIEIEPWFESKS
jgi:hypothetical protein